MPRKFIKRFMPDHEMIKKQKALKVFGNVLYNPNLWCLNRRSAAGAFAVGLFMAFVPLPSQMIMAAGLAILFGVNLPLSVALVWISNPVTMPVLFYFAYKVGAFCMNTPPQPFHFELSWQYLSEQMATIGPHFYSDARFVVSLVRSLVISEFEVFGAIPLYAVGNSAQHVN